MNVTFDYYNVDSLYYVYPDRLGSYTHITNSSKQVVRALHFDPWGNVKSDGYFHSDYLFGSATPHYINYNNCVNLENTLDYAFHEPDMMTDADGTAYRTEYYWAAVGAGGVHQYKVGKGHWKRILSPYKETGRWYTREVAVKSDFPHTSVSSVPLYSDVIMSLNGFSMANGFKTNLMDAAVAYGYKSEWSRRDFVKLKDTQNAFRYNQTLGKTGAMYLKGSKWMGGAASVTSATLEILDYVTSTIDNGFNWWNTMKFAMDMSMTIVGFIGPVGFTISATYFILDATTNGFVGF